MGPAWVAAGVSAIFGIQSWWSSWPSNQAREAADQQAKRATKAAENAVAAQDQIAAEAKRLADATERKRMPPRRTPGESRGTRTDRLRKLTATTKYNVRLRGDPVRVDGRSFFYEIAGNDSPDVDLMEPWRVLVNMTVTVSWYPRKEKVGEPNRQQIQL
jgi:hypothetical protein